ncbi:MAG: hypothetical protein ACRDT6_05685 [Micromonosporaceae bacterium]
MTYPPAAPPPVSPSELRPGRGGYWIAAAIAVLGMILGCAGAVLGGFSLAGEVPKMTQEFRVGESATVKLEAGKEWAVYVDNPALRGSNRTGTSALPEVECSGTASGGGGEITLTEPSGNFTFGDNRRYWQLVYEVKVDKTGSYHIECGTSDSMLRDPTFGVGPALDPGGIVAKVFGSLGALLGIPCLGFIVAGVLAMVVGLRRSSHKKRLQAERAAGGGYPGGPPAGGYPGGPPAAPPGYPPAG